MKLIVEIDEQLIETIDKLLQDHTQDAFVVGSDQRVPIPIGSVVWLDHSGDLLLAIHPDGRPEWGQAFNHTRVGRYSDTLADPTFLRLGRLLTAVEQTQGVLAQIERRAGHSEASPVLSPISDS